MRPWLAICAASALLWFGFQRWDAMGRPSLDTVLHKLRPDLGGLVSFEAATSSPAAAAYERYATAMSMRDFRAAMHASQATAHEIARTRALAATPRSGDGVFLSHKAIAEMGPAPDEFDPPRFEYSYEALQLAESGKIATVDAVQIRHAQSGTLRARHSVTVMEIDGRWKVTEFVHLQ